MGTEKKIEFGYGATVKTELKGQCHAIFDIILFWRTRFDLGPIWPGKNGSANFFIFDKIFDRKVRKSRVRSNFSLGKGVLLFFQIHQFFNNSAVVKQNVFKISNNTGIQIRITILGLNPICMDGTNSDTENSDNICSFLSKLDNICSCLSKFRTISAVFSQNFGQYLQLSLKIGQYLQFSLKILDNICSFLSKFWTISAVVSPIWWTYPEPSPSWWESAGWVWPCSARTLSPPANGG